jgi:hypothetical protein
MDQSKSRTDFFRIGSIDSEYIRSMHNLGENLRESLLPMALQIHDSIWHSAVQDFHRNIRVNLEAASTIKQIAERNMFTNYAGLFAHLPRINELSENFMK